MQADKRSTIGRLSELATDAVGALGKSLGRIVPRARDDALIHIPDEIRPPLAKFRLPSAFLSRQFVNVINVC